MKVISSSPPRVFIAPEAKKRLDLYLALCPEEISGLGEAERVGRDFLVTSVRLFPQEVTAGSTELDGDAVQAFLLELVRAGEDPGRFKCWWHSHVAGSPFWSGTDEATASGFDNGWMLSVVGNNRGEYRVRLDIFEPVRLTLDELELQMYNPPDAAMRAALAEEIREKVRKKELVASSVAGFFRYGEANNDTPRLAAWSPRRRSEDLIIGGE